MKQVRQDILEVQYHISFSLKTATIVWSVCVAWS